jgi:S1-C subfamily serine protease
VRSFGSSLGTVPDYAGPPKGQKGMLLAGVRPGGAADKAGLKRGDILVKLGDHVVSGVEDLMYVLTESKPGTTMKAVVVRDGKEMTVEVTLQGAHRH